MTGLVAQHGVLRVERDELGSLLHQSSGHIGHASRHRRLADAYRVSHGRLEGARRVEAQSGQHLDLRTDGSGALGASAESLKHRSQFRASAGLPEGRVGLLYFTPL